MHRSTWRYVGALEVNALGMNLSRGELSMKWVFWGFVTSLETILEMPTWGSRTLRPPKLGIYTKTMSLCFLKGESGTHLYLLGAVVKWKMMLLSVPKERVWVPKSRSIFLHQETSASLLEHAQSLIYSPSHTPPWWLKSLSSPVVYSVVLSEAATS